MYCVYLQAGWGAESSVSGRPLEGWRVASKGLGPQPRSHKESPGPTQWQGWPSPTGLSVTPSPDPKPTRCPAGPRRGDAGELTLTLTLILSLTSRPLDEATRRHLGPPTSTGIGIRRRRRRTRGSSPQSWTRSRKAPTRADRLLLGRSTPRRTRSPSRRCWLAPPLPRRARAPAASEAERSGSCGPAGAPSSQLGFRLIAR